MSEFFDFCLEHFDEKYSKKFAKLVPAYLLEHCKFLDQDYRNVFWGFEDTLREFVKYEINSEITIDKITYEMPIKSDLWNLSKLVIKDNVATYCYKSGNENEYFTAIPDMELVILDGVKRFDKSLIIGNIGIKYDCVNDRLEYFLIQYFANTNMDVFQHVTKITVKLSDLSICKNRGLLSTNNGIECITKDLLRVHEVLNAI